MMRWVTTIVALVAALGAAASPLEAAPARRPGTDLMRYERAIELACSLGVEPDRRADRLFRRLRQSGQATAVREPAAEFLACDQAP